MKRAILGVLSAAALAGCAHGSGGGASHAGTQRQSGANPAELERIQRRAAVDLNCPVAEVTVEVLEPGTMWRPWSFSARGCEKSASYLSRMGTILRN